ncbi:MAG: large conductance mechanosensitive channel protein MscL, partial [Paramuribaculum intestinale]
VDDIIMPLVGVATGGMNFTDFKWVVQKAVMNGQEIVTPEVSLNWGTWVQTIVDFLIVAFCIFIMVKFINQIRRKKTEEPAPAAAPTHEEELLTEIRDLLKAQNSPENKK